MSRATLEVEDNPTHGPMGDYHKLEVWKLGCELADRVVAVVDALPPRVQAGNGDQLARAADSISEAIAEGCGFNSDPQLAHYLRISLGSANEVQNQLETLQRRRLLSPENEDLIPAIVRLRGKLASFIDTVDPPNNRLNRRRPKRRNR